MGFVVTNGSKRCGMRSSGTPGPLSTTQNSIGSPTRMFEPGTVSRTPGRNAVVNLISPSRRIADRFSGVFNKIKKDLNELITARENWRQGRIVVLDELDVARKTRLREPFHMPEHDMNIDGFALDRPLVGEDIHAIDKLHDPVGLVANQARQHPVLIVRRMFEKLRGTANAGKRIFDFMREHRRERGDGTRGAAMRELPVDLVGHAALLQHENNMAGPFRQRRDMQISKAFAAVSRRAEIDPVFVHGRTGSAHLLDQRDQRASEGNEILQRVAAEHLQSGFKKRFRRDIGFDDMPVRRDGKNRMRQGIQDRFVQHTCVGFCLRDTHAARFHEKSSKASRIPRVTFTGSLSARSFPRQALTSSSVWSDARPATSKVQPRCFRASRTPRAIP